MNLERFKAVLEHIQKNPESWDQDTYTAEPVDHPCGTACCFAGRTLLMFGSEENKRHVTEGTERVFSCIREPAREALELDTEQAEWLFASDRELADFELVAKRGDITPDLWEDE